ncbi:MAG: hypothetical protein R3250_12475 [Melioribacteraceae bacterium]|nr:hypothetical protein [Melioribacteraceae bacterium]
MNHYEEDTLYKFVLDMLDSSHYEDIRSHSAECKECQMKIDEIKSQIELLESFDPEIELDRSKNKKAFSFAWTISKAAALILFGLTIGYSVVNYTMKDKIVVVGQSFIPQDSSKDSLRFVDCPNIDINAEY